MKSLNVLTIGNGFSSDCHTFLPYIAEAEETQLYIANLYIPGGTLEQHYRNWIDENQVYTLEVYLPGEKELIKPDEIALHEVVEDEDFDIIVLQQSSALAGIKSSYKPYLGELAEYCRMMHPNSTVMLHQVPAYSENCKNEAFAKYYNGDSENMHSAIVAACYEAADEAEIDIIIPNAVAWKTARESKIGDRLTINGYHGNEIGNFLSGCVFWQSFTDIKATDIKFNLPEYDKAVSELIKVCAYIAKNTPDD